MNLLELSNIELRQICYFMAVTEAGNNFSKAAEYLHIEQPPLTQRIQSLEKKLKIELFDRKRRPIQLTPAGKVFLTEIELTLASLDRAITTAQRAQRGEIGFQFSKHIKIHVCLSRGRFGNEASEPQPPGCKPHPKPQFLKIVREMSDFPTNH
jgi:DNA-binding MarR family transcriptional regulator